MWTIICKIHYVRELTCQKSFLLFFGAERLQPRRRWRQQRLAAAAVAAGNKFERFWHFGHFGRLQTFGIIFGLFLDEYGRFGSFLDLWGASEIY